MFRAWLQGAIAAIGRKRNLKQFGSLLFHELLLALLITHLVMPPQAFAPPPTGPEGEEQPIEEPSEPSERIGEAASPNVEYEIEVNRLAEEEEALDRQSRAGAPVRPEVLTIEAAIERLGRPLPQLTGDEGRIGEIQEARDRAIGLDPLAAFEDPYRIKDQKVIVIENVPGSESIDPQQIDSIQGTRSEYSLLETNPAFPTAPIGYRLDRDIKVRVDEANGLLQLVYHSRDGQPLPENRIYIQQIHLPGIQSVIKDRTHVHVLLKNGEIRTIFMAHAWLYKANARALGGPLIVPFIGAVPMSHINQNNWLVDSNIRLEFYDSRRTAGLDFSDVPTEDLRYGDVLMVSGNKVVDANRYPAITDAIRFHTNLIAVRQQLVDGQLTPVEAASLLVSYGAEVERAPALHEVMNNLLRGQQAENVLPVIQGLSQYTGLTAADWKEVPWEDKVRGSARTQQHLAMVAAMESLASDPINRSTYAHVSGRNGEPTPDESMQTIEDEVREMVKKAAAGAEQKTWLGWLGGTVFSAAKYIGKKALIVGGLGSATAGGMAAYKGSDFLGELWALPQSLWNQLVHLLPSGYIAFDLDAKVKLYDIFGFEGPEVWYLAKFGGLCIGMTVMLVSAVLAAANFDKLVLKREEPKSTLKERGLTGLKVWYTFCLRTLAPLFGSMGRTGLAWVLGFSEQLDAARMGIPPATFALHGGKAVGAMAIREKLERATILSQRVTLQILLQQLVAQGLCSPDTALDIKALKEHLGETRFVQVMTRAELLSSRVWAHIEERIASKRGKLDENELLELEKSIFASESLGSCTIDLDSDLDADELAELRAARKIRRTGQRWMNFAGQNQLYYEFRDGEMADNVIREAIGWNSVFDVISHAPMGLVVPEWSDLNQPELLVATDQSFLGVVSSKFMAETAGNMAAWASAAGQEQMVWARKGAARIADDYYNPENLESVYETENGQEPKTFRARVAGLFKSLRNMFSSSVNPSAMSLLDQELMNARGADINEAAARYNRGYWGLNIPYAFQKVGERISFAEPKGIKLLFTVALAIAAWGYIWDIDFAKYGLEQFSDLMTPEGLDGLKDVAGFTLMMAAVKVTAGAAAAYATYRILWPPHNLGQAEHDGGIRADRNRYRQLLVHIFTEAVLLRRCIEAEGPDFAVAAAHETRLRGHLTALRNIFLQHDKEPPLGDVNLEMLQGQDLIKHVEDVTRTAVPNPPTPMRENSLHKGGTAVYAACITTIVGLTAFAYAWGFSKQVIVDNGIYGLAAIPAIMAATYAGGRGLLVGGRAARAHFGYVHTVRRIRSLLDRRGDYDPNNPRERRYVYEELMRARRLYRHYHTDLPASALDMNAVYPEAPNLMASVESVYAHMLASPPTNPAVPGQGFIAREIERQRRTPPPAPTVDETVQPRGIRSRWRKCKDAIADGVNAVLGRERITPAE